MMGSFPKVSAVWRPSTWYTSVRLFLATFGGALLALYIVIVVVDPYGVVPFSPPFERPLVSSQRQMYPQILRTGRYDSIVVGTSTSKLLDPAALGRVLGGHFATFAMAQATAREQVEILDYFARTVPAPRVVLIGVDHEWCYRNGTAGVREREFPSWAYDGDRWNDLLYLLNGPTLESALHALGSMMGRYPAHLRADGFEGDSPRDAIYDVSLARQVIAAGEPRAVRDALALSEADPDAIAFEALPWLDGALAALPAETRKILVFPPVDARALPAAGSHAEAMDNECKRRVTVIARRLGAILVDFRLVSPLTTEDANFWDLIHYRLGVGYRLIDDIGRSVKEGRDPEDGHYRILVR